MRSLPWASLGLTIGFLSFSGRAQIVGDRASDNSDIRGVEQSRLGAATSQESGGWDLEFNLPLHWSSNAVQTFGPESISRGHRGPTGVLARMYCSVIPVSLIG